MNIINNLIFTLMCISFPLSAYSINQECVILLHGFGKTSRSMSNIAKFLEAYNYKVLNINYPSRKHDIYTIVEKYVKPQISEYIAKYSKIHFVGYSMGGVISRLIIENNKIPNLGNVVLIASPINGSDISSVIAKSYLLKSLFGPAVADLAVGSKCINSLKKKCNYKIGIVSANMSHNLITSLLFLPGQNDGIVTLDSTLTDSATDSIILETNHNSIIYLEITQKQILHFLKNSQFLK